jgi:hypothetical protein
MAAQSVHRTTADEPDQTGCHEGPMIHFDRPVQEPLPQTSFVFLWALGPAALQRCKAIGTLATPCDHLSSHNAKSHPYI